MLVPVTSGMVGNEVVADSKLWLQEADVTVNRSTGRQMLNKGVATLHGNSQHGNGVGGGNLD